MRMIEKLKQIERIDKLIRRKSTGTPKELANRLAISERALYNCIDVMKKMNAPIYYCRNSQSYCYEYPVECSIGFNNSNGGIKINGGTNPRMMMSTLLHFIN